MYIGTQKLGAGGTAIIVLKILAASTVHNLSLRMTSHLDYDGLDMYREWARIELPKEYYI
jgi:hypothetical protein